MMWRSGTVAPLVGAWIEIVTFNYYGLECKVAPLVGAWIEMTVQFQSQS